MTCSDSPTSAPAAPDAPLQPSLPWRTASSITMGIIGTLSRSFLLGLNETRTIGLERFIEVLDGRVNPGDRDRGLLTVSNHVCVVDDPVIWGVLPYSYAFNPGNHRWTLGSYDLCFTNKGLSTFFTLGQLLPTHRKKHSTYGGLFQPTIGQAIRLLSAQPFSSKDSFASSASPASPASKRFKSPDIDDPFTAGHFTYSTNGTDTFVSPAAYLSRRHSWVHIFPEGFINQHPLRTMRYFKWGVSRLILESEPLPTIVPIFVDGTQEVMHESREFPKFLPRIGKKITIIFGEQVDGEKVFGDLRARWKRLVDLQKEALRNKGQDDDLVMGELTEGLKYGEEAVAIRIEVTKRVRQEVLKLRKKFGLPDEDPKQGLVETWMNPGKQKGKMENGSWIKEN